METQLLRVVPGALLGLAPVKAHGCRKRHERMTSWKMEKAWDHEDVSLSIAIWKCPEGNLLKISTFSFIYGVAQFWKIRAFLKEPQKMVEDGRCFLVGFSATRCPTFLRNFQSKTWHSNPKKPKTIHVIFPPFQSMPKKMYRTIRSTLPRIFNGGWVLGNSTKQWPEG